MRGRRSHVVWMEGATWVFQGTIQEDSAVGTHISSLTVTPGAGNEMRILYGGVVAGNGAANLVFVKVTDGTNLIARFANGTSLAANEQWYFPSTGASASGQVVAAAFPVFVSGTMSLQIAISTATVSLTHTFSLACRILGNVPTAVLADSVGTPTLTTNTNRVF